MKSLLQKDKKRRKLFLKYENKKIIYKYIYNNLSLSKELRKKAFNNLMKMPRNSSITRVRNRCVITSRARSIYRYFKMSRLVFRQLALEGKLPGVRKASW